MSRSRLIFFLIIFSASTLANDSLPISIKEHLLTGDYTLAASELRALVAEGNHDAQYQLAVLYLNGNGIAQSTSQAEALLISSAESNADAAYLLGSLYHQGNRLKADPQKAKIFLTKAVSLGNQRAQILLDKIISKNSTTGPRIRAQTQQSFSLALRSGDLSSVIKYYNLGANLDYPGDLGVAPIIAAIKLDRQPVALWLARQNIDLAQRDDSGNTALHYAAKLDQLKIIIALSNKIKNLDLVNNQGQTPLMFAIIEQHQATAQWLLNRNANPELADKQNLTAKDYNLKAKLTLDYSQTKSATKLAKTDFSAQQLEHRLQALKLQSASQDNLYSGWPLLLIATAQNQVDLAKHLLANGEDPWQINANGHSSIYFALQNKNTGLLDQMLRQFPITAQRNGLAIETVFLLAVENNRADLVGKILDTQSTSRHDELISKGLNSAIDSDQLDTAKNLIARLTSPPSGELLHSAINQNRLRIAALLVTEGAPLDWRDSNGRTALMAAVQNSNAELLKILDNGKFDIALVDNQQMTALMLATKNHCLACVEHLLTLGADPERQSINGNSALMFAAQGANDILRIFLRQKRDLSKRNNQSLTALMLAVEKNCLECAETLLKAGANPKRRNAKGDDSYDLAKGKPEFLALLERY